MIIPTSFVVVSFTIGMIKVILSGTIGAILGFYVKYSRDEYADSIRWSRTGGFYEMISLYRNSCRQLPSRSRAIMILMISASLSTLFVTILLGAAVSRTDIAGTSATMGVFTQQPMPGDPTQWTDWSAYMESDATMAGTMASLFNDTRFNPYPSPRTVYTPHTYPYDVPCNETGAVISKNTQEMPFPYPSHHDNCKVVFLQIDSIIYDWDDKRASNRLISPDLHMVVAPLSYRKDGLFEMEPEFYAYNGKFCSLKGPTAASFNTFPKDGFTALPRTDAVRCQFGSDDSFILAATFIKFAVNRLTDFNKVTAMIFDDPSNLPLLQSMNAAINNDTFSSPINNSTMVLFTSLSTNVDFLVCVSKFLVQQNGMALLCTYLTTATIMVKPQPWDPAIAADFKRNSTLSVKPDSIRNQNDISVYHMPLGSRTNMITFSAAHLLQATTEATEYFASLGHNVVMDLQTERLFVLFDAVKLRDAFEVSTTLLIVTGSIVCVCLFLWVISEIRDPAVYNGSLYKTIYKEIKSKEEDTPMLMDFKQDPLVFHGYQVIPNLAEQPKDPQQEVPMVILDIVSAQESPTQEISMQEIPMQQLSTRHSPMKSEILDQSPLLTPAAAPATIATNNSASATPIMPPSALPWSLESHRNITLTSPVQTPPLVHTTTHSIEDAPSSSPPLNQKSTPIQSPFL
ncbi:hypothetical protein BGW39_005103 [Mortierella sp. 14UC]|nr:hypothetical protein BGW39_005103 [Mortierella sp. 14UC]